MALALTPARSARASWVSSASRRYCLSILANGGKCAMAMICPPALPSSPVGATGCPGAQDPADAASRASGSVSLDRAIADRLVHFDESRPREFLRRERTVFERTVGSVVPQAALDVDPLLEV